MCPVCKQDAHAPASDADVEAGLAGADSSPAQARGRQGFLLGRLGASWFAVRRHLSPRAQRGRSGASPAASSSPGGDAEPSAVEQPLLGPGSRASTPIPTANTLQPQESAATLINFPAFFPAR